MINVNQITAQMARMPDAALQRYAQMNKSDPYIVSLALSESNRRKELRTGAQMNAPQQPKVVDQELAGMGGLPMLPADNLRGMEQSMAAGGIVAFDEGGEVPRFNGNQSQFVQDINALGSYLTPFSKERMDRIRAEDAAKAAAEKESAAKRAALIESGRPRSLAATLSNYFTSPNAKMQEAESFLPTAPQAPTEQAVLQATQNVKTPAGSPAAANMATLDGAPPAAAGQKPTASPTPSADKSGLYALNKPAFVPGQGLGLASSPTTLKQEFQSLMPEGPVVDPFEARTKKLGEERIKGAEETEALRKRQVEEAGLAGLKEEERLKAREEKLGKSESELGGMALLKAGFAMMSGTSPHALANIGIGANVGLEDYAKGREKIDASRERLDDANARLEQMRRGETMMNQREQRTNMKDISAAKVKAEEEGIAGLRQALGIQREDARTIYTAWNQQNLVKAETTSRERMGLAQIAAQKDIANMLPGETRTAMFFGKGNTPQEKFLSGMKVITEATADKTGMAAVKLLTETNTKRAAAGDAPITMQELLASAREYNALMYPKETSTPPKGAQLLQQ
jgi:hypothetical protein